MYRPYLQKRGYAPCRQVLADGLALYVSLCVCSEAGKLQTSSDRQRGKTDGVKLYQHNCGCKGVSHTQTFLYLMPQVLTDAYIPRGADSRSTGFDAIGCIDEQLGG